MPAAVALRPRSFSELFDAAFLLARANLQPLIVLSAIAAIPGLVVTAINATVFGANPLTLATNPATFGRLMIGSFVVMCWLFVGIGAMVGAASNAYLGEPVDPAASLRQALGRAGSLVGAHLLAYLRVLGAVLLGTVGGALVTSLAGGAAAAVSKGPGAGAAPVLTHVLPAIGAILLLAVLVWALFVLARYATVSAAVMLERLTAGAAVRRARELSTGHVRRVVGIFVLLGVVSIALTALALGVAALIRNLWVSNVVSALLWIPLYPFVACVLTVVYYDLRIRKEGFDIEHAARELERPGGSPPAAAAAF